MISNENDMLYSVNGMRICKKNIYNIELRIINKNKRIPIFNKRILNNIQYTMYIKQKTFINKKCANNLVKCVEVKWGEVQGMEVGWRLAQRDDHAATRGAH
jgi:hypothetical protein